MYVIYERRDVNRQQRNSCVSTVALHATMPPLRHFARLAERFWHIRLRLLRATVNLRQFDLNLLVALDVLLTERNVTRAGERLYLSQPAMSGILARLRHAFHDELLVRVGRNLELTALATELAGPVHATVHMGLMP